MRVTSGFLKGRQVTLPKSSRIRPTTDKIRLALFSIIQDRIQSAFVLDLFAGSGIFGVEALSRGAGWVDFVDINVSSVKKNTSDIDIKNFRIIKKDFRRFLKSCEKRKYNIVFIDPPYGFYSPREILTLVKNNEILEKNGILIYEEHINTDIDYSGTGMKLTDERRYGDTMIRIFRGEQ
ncbi:methyltransferase [Flexistipes sinusarabici DSM 4947]|uniref:Methyltransferase n=1 Tax=Flexistipes sinusarabici (strain ATCC 49648 / DSM 4947 / MAS 10) TaxID=717231 RepID=F8E796_FLESM|nr:16S rRNA (guanine(966)-N(2))-methyltransferase RsmD [Flexistipes sinusarabici]AEI13811.1 methyltransferase [Flexistipes sinusarabici DSM 4947]